MTEMVFGAVAVKSAEPAFSRWWRTVDRWVLAAIIILFVIGLFLGMAASPPLAAKHGFSTFYFVGRQAFFGLLALVVMIFVSIQEPQRVKRWAIICFFLSFVALILLPVFGTNFGKGAMRWYSLGFVAVQPSEFIKPVFVVFIAWLMSASNDIAGPPGKSLSFLVTVIVVLILVLQPDFGQAVLILFSWALMFFIAGAPKTLMIVVGAMTSLAGMAAYNFSPHFASRINGFLSGDIDPTTQIGFATEAIQEGGFFGVGIGQGTIKWSLPDAHTDFIIAVAAEEFGLVLTLIIVALFMFITMRSLMLLRRERDPFTRLAGVGLAVLLGMQALINLGVAVRLVPTKGMTLPFISYGGSSLLAIGVLFGMLLAFTRQRPQNEMMDILGRGK
ncbi:MAG: putative lipid II flippase FtsW [Rhodobacteraceae bacterium]|nr:putative lipid II flippase FtsW [Paracoccaceae bacterium]